MPLYNQFSVNLIYFLIQFLTFMPIILLANKKNVEYCKGVSFNIISSISLALIQTLFSTKILEFNTILVMFMIFVESYFIFNIDLLSSFVSTSICSLISFLSNIICVSFSAFSSIEFFSINYLLVIMIINVIFYKYLSNYELDKLIFQLKTHSNTSSFMPFILLIFSLSYNFTAINSIDILYFSMLTQFVISIYIFKIIISQTSSNTTKLSMKTMHIEQKELKKVIDGIRVFKHDYSNTLSSIGGYISLNDMKGLRKYYDKLTIELNNTNNLQMINKLTINEPSIYNLLASKHNIILQNNLKFDFYSSINYKDLNVCIYDFSKLLGIFLDNAIDAANKSKEREISLTCRKNINKDYQITIKNSYINKDVDIKKIYLKGYSSKSIKSGLGLWEVSKILKSNPNIKLNTDKDNSYFTQTLVISA